MGKRVSRSIMNMKVGMFFYLLTFLLAFFSRNIFLKCLGAEFMGLTGVLQNILSYLNVAELGIGTSITFFLYKPLQQDDKAKTTEIMSVLAWLYRCIGFFIGGVGVFVSLSFPFFFGGLTIQLPLVYFAFYSFLATSMAGYLINKNGKSLADYLEDVVFAGNTGVSIAPTAEDVAGFEKYIENYKNCLPIEQAAVDAKK